MFLTMYEFYLVINIILAGGNGNANECPNRKFNS